jgi:hypothetical protein
MALKSAVAVLLFVVFPAFPSQILVSDDFESGLLGGWTTTFTNSSGGCGVMVVNSTGVMPCGTLPGPVQGQYAAYVGMTPGAGMQYIEIQKSFIVPFDIVTATLSWYDTWNWSLSPESGGMAYWVRFHDGAIPIPFQEIWVMPGTTGAQPWTLHTADVTAFLRMREGSSTNPLSITYSTNGIAGSAVFGIDDIRLEVTTAIPEPAMWTLSLLGLGMLAWLRRRAA